MRRAPAAVVLALAALATVAACGSGSSSPPPNVADPSAVLFELTPQP